MSANITHTKSKYIYILILPIIVIIIDQLTKYLIIFNMQLSQSIPIINNVFHLTYIHNTGTLFGLFSSSNMANMLFIWLIIIIIGVILWLFDRFDRNEAILFSLVIGAAIGNLIDRIIYGHVIDFLDFRVWPVFNVADSVVSICVILLIIYLIRKK
ncbi:MAG: signal peptidase II [Candidatus Woesearchaeota archaeon]